MAKQFANSGDFDQMPHSVASDLGLHCLLITLYGSVQTKMGCFVFVVSGPAVVSIPDIFRHVCVN